MSDKMIVPMGVVGGNKIEMVNPRVAGKIRVTNPEGKVKTLSVDEFQKQVNDNKDKLVNGEDVEFESSNGKKALKIGAAAVGTAAVVAGVIYRKDIAKYVKNFTWKGFKEDIKGLGKKFGRGVKKLFKSDKKTGIQNRCHGINRPFHLHQRPLPCLRRQAGSDSGNRRRRSGGFHHCKLRLYRPDPHVP